MNNTDFLGEYGEHKVQLALMELGFMLYTPLSKQSRIDLVGEYNNKLYKFQIKTRQKSENGKITFKLTSNCPCENKKYNTKSYSPEEIDFFLLYNYEKDVIYLLKNNDDANKITFIIVYDDYKDKIYKTMHFEKDYLLKNIFNNYFK